MERQQRDIYNLLLEAERKRKRKAREELLRNIGVSEEYFKEGTIKINDLTCRGSECKLCITACPTNALYWKDGNVKVEVDLCIYCGACVLNCIVDDCILVTRKRKNGEVERFSTPRQLVILTNRQAADRREEVLRLILAELKKAQKGTNINNLD